MIASPELLALPQWERIIEFLKIRGKNGAYNYELSNSRPTGLGVTHFTARIAELRKGKYNDTFYNIVHDGDKFVLNTPELWLHPPKVETIEEKKQKLRILWTRAKKANDESQMKMIQSRARLLDLAEKNKQSQTEPSPSISNQVAEVRKYLL